MEQIKKHMKIIKHDRDKIAIVRDTALLLGCSPDLVAYIQGDFNEQNDKLEMERSKLL